MPTRRATTCRPPNPSRPESSTCQAARSWPERRSMTDARRVAVVTSTRADYGLLRWTMQSLRDDPRAQLQVIATGTHLSSAFGRTIDAIKGDGFDIDAEVDMPLDDSDGLASAEAA